MSPIAPGSKLGRVIAIKKELMNLLTKISAINSSNTNSDTTKLKVKLILANITRIKTSWTKYLNLAGEEDRQPINDDLNISIANILISGQTIKNSLETLNFLNSNLNTLSQQTTTAISQTANLASILDLRDRIAQASNRSSIPVPPPPSPHLSPLFPLSQLSSLPLPPPPPFSAPPGLRRQPNIGRQQRGLVRQQTTHLLLDGLEDLNDLRLGLGKKYFKQRRLTHRNKLRGQKSRKRYKTRRA